MKTTERIVSEIRPIKSNWINNKPDGEKRDTHNMCQELRLVPATTHHIQDVLKLPAVDTSKRISQGGRKTREAEQARHEMSVPRKL